MVAGVLIRSGAGRGSTVHIKGKGQDHRWRGCRSGHRWLDGRACDRISIGAIGRPLADCFIHAGSGLKKAASCGGLLSVLRPPGPPPEQPDSEPDRKIDKNQNAKQDQRGFHDS
jgi:hypothetical protein